MTGNKTGLLTTTVCSPCCCLVKDTEVTTKPTILWYTLWLASCMYKYSWWHQTGSCTADPLVLYPPARSPSLPQTTVLWLSQTAAAPQLPSLPSLHCWRPPGRDHPAATAQQRSHSQMDTQRTSETTEYDFHQTISKKHLLTTYSTVEVRPPCHDGVCGWSNSEQLSQFLQQRLQDKPRCLLFTDSGHCNDFGIDL